MGFAGLLALGISVPILYYYNDESARVIDDKAFTCPYINDLGNAVDVGTLFINTITTQFWVYTILSVLVLFTLLGAYCAHCRCCNALMHTLGFFAHVYAIGHLGTTIFGQPAKLCTENENLPLYKTGQFLW